MVDGGGTRITDDAAITKAFIGFYEGHFGYSLSNRIQLKIGIMNRGPILTTLYRSILEWDYTTTEIKQAVFAIPGRKAPGPDGYGAYFFQDTSGIIGCSVEEAVLSMLRTMKFVKEINNTIITLMPKTICLNGVGDYWPISCCNIIYKVAMKVICMRLKLLLPEIIMPNQGGFVHGRFIAHNVMICQDIIRHLWEESG